MDNLSLKDFLDTRVLAQLQVGFNKSTGLSSYTVDSKSIISPITGQSEFCSLIKNSDGGLQKCGICTNSAKEQAFRSCRVSMTTCFTGMVEFAVPFVIGGSCLGAMIIGEVFLEKPAETKLKAIAHELNIDENKLISAANKIKVMTKAQAEANVDFLFTMANVYLDMGKQCLDAKGKFETHKKDSEKLKDFISEAQNLLGTSGTTVNSLYKQFEELDKLSESATLQLANTSETVKLIQDIALNTRILGFNASIEASRAKEAGKGFGVIAQEVRGLADVSKTSAETIEEIVQSINETTQQIRQTIIETGEKVKTNFQNLGKMNGIFEQMKLISKDLD